MYNKQTCKCIVLTQGNEKILMKFAAVSAKMLKTVKCLAKILFSIDILNLCLPPYFCILFKRRLQSVTKVFMSKVVLAKLKIPQPVDA